MEDLRQATPQPGTQGVITNGARDDTPNGTASPLEHWTYSVKTSTNRALKLFKGVIIPRHDPVRQVPDVQASIALSSGAVATHAQAPASAPAPQAPAQVVSQVATSRGQVVSTTQPQSLQIHGHQATRIGKDCYSLLSMPIPDDAWRFWKTEIEERLTNELRAETGFRGVSCQPELLMVCDAVGTINPCIVLSVWNRRLCVDQAGIKKTVHKARKIVRKLPVTETCPYVIRVIADQTFFAARLVLQNSLPVSAVHTSVRDISSLTSLEITASITRHQLFRLGGLIIVGQQVYGLTVAHPVIQHLDVHDTISLESDGDDDEPEASDDSSEDSGSEDVLFDPHRYNITRKPVGRSFEHSDNTNPAVEGDGLSGQIRSTSPSTGPVGQVVAISGNESLRTVEADWALIALDDDVPRVPNLYFPTPGANPVHIEAVDVGPAKRGTQVTIIAAQHHLVDGVVGQSDVSVTIGGTNVVVTQIILASPLEPGYSGCWVVRGGVLIGCIVATRRFLPLVYMTSISSIFNEISGHFAGADIQVATVHSLKAIQQVVPFHRLENEDSAGEEVSVGTPLHGSPRRSLDSDPREARRDATQSTQKLPKTSGRLSLGFWPISSMLHPGMRWRRPLARRPGGSNGDTIHRDQPARTLRQHVESDTNYPQLTENQLEAAVEDADDVSSGPRRTETEESISAISSFVPEDHDSVVSVPHQLAQPHGQSVTKDLKMKLKLVVLAIIACQTFVTCVALTIPLVDLDTISDSLDYSSSPVKTQMVFSIFALGQIFGSLSALPLSALLGRQGTLLFFSACFTAFNFAGISASDSTALIVFRLFIGFGGGGLFTIGRMIVTELFKPTRHVKYHAVLSLCNILGKSFGPLIGASIKIGKFERQQAQSLLVGIMGAALLVCSWTVHTGLYRHREEASFLQVPIWTKFEARRMTPVGSSLRTAIAEIQSEFVTAFVNSYFRPLRYLLTEPIVIAISLCCGLAFGILFFMLSTSARLLREQYHRSSLIVGTAYLSYGLGDMLGVALSRRFDVLVRNTRPFKRNHGVWRPENNLPSGIMGFIWLAGGFLMYGWTATADTSVVGPIFGQIIFSSGLMAVHLSLSQYLVEAYTVYASYVMSAVLVVSYVFEFAYPLFAFAITKGRGYGLSSTILGVPTLVIGLLTCVAGLTFGSQIRRRSKLTRNEDGMDEKRQRPPERGMTGVSNEGNKENRYSLEV